MESTVESTHESNGIAKSDCDLSSFEVIKKVLTLPECYPYVVYIYYSGETPLTCAAQAGHYNVVKALIEHGINLKSTEATKALAYACMNKHSTPIAHLLIEYGADPNNSINLAPPLHHAIRAGDSLLVSRLLDAGALVNSNEVFNSPLHVACNWDNPEIVKLLLKKGAKVNATNDQDNTALFFARSPQVVDCLISHGACVNHLNSKKQTPLMALLRLKSAAILNLLLKAGADCNYVDQDGSTLIVRAMTAIQSWNLKSSENEGKKIIKLLIPYSRLGQIIEKETLTCPNEIYLTYESVGQMLDRFCKENQIKIKWSSHQVRQWMCAIKRVSREVIGFSFF